MKRTGILIAVAVLLVAISAFLTFRVSPTTQAEERVPLKIGIPEGGKVTKTDEEWRASLTPDAYRITRQRGTERACSAAGWNNKADGYYECIGCGQRLFDSGTKYESGTGWPSFYKPADENAISLYAEKSIHGNRVEVTCSKCDAHLGHVFDDGPPPTGRRFCMNAGAMKFVPR